MGKPTGSQNDGRGSPPAPAAEQPAAEALYPHAHLTLRMPDGEERRVTPADPLPAGPFEVVKIETDGGPPFDREFFAGQFLPAVRGLAALHHLWDLGGRTTGPGADALTTEEDVEHIAAAPAGTSLTTLGLRPPLTTRAVRALARMPRLTHCVAHGKEAADDALVELAKVTRFQELHLGNGLGASGRVTGRGSRPSPGCR